MMSNSTSMSRLSRTQPKGKQPLLSPLSPSHCLQAPRLGTGVLQSPSTSLHFPLLAHHQILFRRHLEFMFVILPIKELKEVGGKESNFRIFSCYSQVDGNAMIVFSYVLVECCSTHLH